MSRGFLAAVLGALALLAAPVYGWSQDPPAERKAEMEGLWPSERLTELMLKRWSEEAADEYKFDERQVEQLQEQMVKRWGGFLKENRESIQPVLNEFIEMRMEMEPPSKDRVQAWAKKTQGVFDKFRKEIDGGVGDFRGILNPLQRAKFEREVLEFTAGMEVARQKLQQWERGEFEPDEFWEPTRKERERRRAERREAEGEAAAPLPEPPDQISRELDAWERYVQEFTKTYGLDESQKCTAASCLKELSERAAAYRDRNRERINQLERRIANNDGSEEELAAIKKELIEIYGPVDDMFKELQARLEALPTAEQKAKVAQGAPSEGGM